MKTLIKSNPEQQIFRDVFSPFMDQFFHQNDVVNDYFTPKANIVEHEKSFDIVIALPGLSKKDIKIDLKDNSLTVSGSHNPSAMKEGSKLLVKELQNGAFSRVFKIGNQIDVESISAEFTDGLLHIHLAKTEQASPKVISIK